jgi:hypothetical protein
MDILFFFGYPEDRGISMKQQYLYSIYMALHPKTTSNVETQISSKVGVGGLGGVINLKACNPEKRIL